MDYKKLANEYFISATIIKERVDKLRILQKSKKYEDQKGLEDRIVVLNAEYHYLLRTANYLEHYYDEDDRKEENVEEKCLIEPISTSANTVINCVFYLGSDFNTKIKL